MVPHHSRLEGSSSAQVVCAPLCVPPLRSCCPLGPGCAGAAEFVIELPAPQKAWTCPPVHALMRAALVQYLDTPNPCLGTAAMHRRIGCPS